MPILITAHVKGQTKEGYLMILNGIGEYLKNAPGLIMHTAHTADDGVTVVEIWNSKEEGDAWFSKNVVPNLPPGIHPKRQYQELYSLILKA